MAMAAMASAMVVLNSMLMHKIVTTELMLMGFRTAQMLWAANCGITGDSGETNKAAGKTKLLLGYWFCPLSSAVYTNFLLALVEPSSNQSIPIHYTKISHGLAMHLILRACPLPAKKSDAC